MKGLWILFALLLWHKPTQSVEFPMVYVLYDNLPDYLRINIELASRRNPVVIITDQQHSWDPVEENVTHNVTFLPMSKYSDSANGFAKVYHHLMKRDHSEGRRTHELRCHLRWFVLRDYMKKEGVDKAMFGDGDSSMFVGAKEAWEKRPGCDASVNVESQPSVFHWVAAGEASLWSLAAIDDFCDFTYQIHTRYRSTIEWKWKKSSNVVDMSVLWLWWVAHHDGPGWDAGRPWFHYDHRANSQQIDERRKTTDEAVAETKKLTMPGVNASLRLCNGLDVYGGSFFDHMHGWSAGPKFSLNLDGDGVPSIVGPCGHSGGKPETVDPAAVEPLRDRTLKLNNIHFQGDSKLKLPYDVCRVLSLTGSREFTSRHVKNLCEQTLRAHPGLPCQDHHGFMGDPPPICF